MATYNTITFTGDKSKGAAGFVKYRKISNLERHLNFITEKYPNWVFMNVYDWETNEIKTIKKNAPH